MKKPKKAMTTEEKKTTNAVFLLIFPTLIIGILAVANGSILQVLIVISLMAYQFLMLKKFVEDYYKK